MVNRQKNEYFLLAHAFDGMLEYDNVALCTHIINRIDGFYWQIVKITSILYFAHALDGMLEYDDVAPTNF